MAFSKIIFNGTTLMDVTGDTVDTTNLLTGYTATKNDGTSITGAYTPSGGGQTEASIESGVIFIDYDGTIVEEWESSTVSGKSALPSNPTHTGLTAQGWNWSLANIKAYIADYPDALMTVGQMFTTTSGATEIDITLDNDTLHPYLGIAPNGTITVDWGDNSATTTLTGTDLTTTKWADHIYTTAGNYTIKLTVQSGSFALYCTASSYAAVLSYKNDFNYSRKYNGCIKAIRIGASASIGYSAFSNCNAVRSITIPDSVTSIGNYAFSGRYAVQSITIPDSVTSIGTYTFHGCYAVQSITIPDSVTSIGTYAFYGCYAVQSITIPDSVTSIGNSAFYNCYAARTITISDSVTSIGNSAFYNCYAARTITISDSVTSIGSSAFYNCYSADAVYLYPTTPPTLANNNAFNNIGTDCIIYVPYSADHSILQAYKTATNWSTYASKMQEMPA